MTKAERQYLESKVAGALPEELLVLLLDGAIRFAERARAAGPEKDREEYRRLLDRAERIVVELRSALPEREMDASLYRNLVGLYGFVQDRLLRAGVGGETALVEEALNILAGLREMWAAAVEKDVRERSALAAAPAVPVGAAPAVPVDLRG